MPRQAVSSCKTTYIKVVVTNSSNLKEFKEIVREVFRIAKPSELAGFIIQPSYRIDEPTLDVLFGFYDTVYPMYHIGARCTTTTQDYRSQVKGKNDNRQKKYQQEKVAKLVRQLLMRAWREP